MTKKSKTEEGIHIRLYNFFANLFCGCSYDDNSQEAVFISVDFPSEGEDHANNHNTGHNTLHPHTSSAFSYLDNHPQTRQKLEKKAGEGNFVSLAMSQAYNIVHPRHHHDNGYVYDEAFHTNSKWWLDQY